MLTIENIGKILYKQLGKKNFYVEAINELSDIHPNSSTRTNHRYRIELTNRKYAINVFLDRVAVINEQNYYRLYAADTGIQIWVTIGEIRNIDKFLDKIRYVGI